MPEAGKDRALKHYLRLQMIRLSRLAEHPHDIALGVAFGIFVSFTPFLGFHLILATVLCVIFGGSKVASWIGTIVGNPATFPVFFWADYRLGSWMTTLVGLSPSGGAVNGINMAHLTFDSFFQNFTTLILPIILGAMILGPLAAAAGYYATYSFVAMARHRRHQRMSAARKRHVR